MKKLLIFILAAILLTTNAAAGGDDATETGDIDMEEDSGEVDASIFDDDIAVLNLEDIDIPAPSAILIEKETGTVIYEKNADEQLIPASVTKVMTILLIVEAVDSGAITMDDMVTVSSRAASMGGSQVYLEEGEQMRVSEMLKCIVVSSANDAAVTMAEHLCGTESVFVSKMNERAKELGCTNTNFTNCTGLMEDSTHVTTARDLALMSRELIKHDWIKEYTTIWMDTVRNGAFGLSNTNKLIYYYDGATGLKTGFTQAAGHCLAATAERDGVEYIAVVLHCDTSTDRFESAKTLLSFAFANYELVSAMPDETLAPVAVNLGQQSSVQPVLENQRSLLIENTQASTITKTLELTGEVTAPVAQGQLLGTLTIANGDTVLAEIPIVASADVARLTTGQLFAHMLSLFFTGAA